VEALHRDAGGGTQDPAASAAHLGDQHHRLLGVRADEHTFIQQGSALNMSIMSVSVPPASMASFKVACVFTWVMLYGKVIVPVLRGFSSGGDGEPSLLQRMGAGRLLMALAMAVSGLVEMKRLDSAAHGEQITIAWQLPQYFLLAGAEVFCYIAQLEFFYA
jgi:peptide/histidine transporter 3/4